MSTIRRNQIVTVVSKYASISDTRLETRAKLTNTGIPQKDVFVDSGKNAPLQHKMGLKQFFAQMDMREKQELYKCLSAKPAFVKEGDLGTLDFERQQLSALLRKMEQDMSSYSSESKKSSNAWSDGIKG